MKLALGTVQFGMDYGVTNTAGKPSRSAVQSILDAADKAGVDCLDSAILYGDSETVLGNIGVSQFDVISKLPSVESGWSNINDWIDVSVSGSLERLDKPSLKALLLHRPEDLFAAQGADLYNALLRQKHEGRAEQIGVSVYSPNQLAKLLEGFDFDVVQIPNSVADQRLQESGLIPKLQARGVEIHARSLFLQGLLLSPPLDLPAKFKQWQHVWNDWQSSLASQDITALEACLSFINQQNCIDKLIVGTESLAQFAEIVNAVRHPKTFERPSTMSGLDELLLNPARWGEL